MMKKIFLFILSAASLSYKAQQMFPLRTFINIPENSYEKDTNNKLQDYVGIWISSHNDVIKINEDGDRFNILSTNETQEQLNVKISKDSLCFYTRYTKAGSDKTYVSEYNFHIKKMTASKLILIPTSTLSKDFFKNKKEITFTKQEFNSDKSISFEKLIYRTTLCYGDCSVINLT